MGVDTGTKVYGNCQDCLLNEPNVWKHVVGVYNGTHVMTYVDALLGGRDRPGSIGALTGNIRNTPHLLAIGAQSDGLGSYWIGYIDDVLIYNRSLSEGEIQQIHSAQAK